MLPDRYAPATRRRPRESRLGIRSSASGAHPMQPTRHPSILPILVLSGLVIVAAACSTSGGLGQVPTTPPTPAQSIESGPPDQTPAPSVSPSPTESGGPSTGASGS